METRWEQNEILSHKHIEKFMIRSLSIKGDNFFKWFTYSKYWPEINVNIDGEKDVNSSLTKTSSIHFDSDLCSIFIFTATNSFDFIFSSYAQFFLNCHVVDIIGAFHQLPMTANFLY